MQSDKLWETFLQSGCVADYLAYRQSLQAELGTELHPLTQQLPHSADAQKTRGEK